MSYQINVRMIRLIAIITMVLLLNSLSLQCFTQVPGKAEVFKMASEFCEIFSATTGRKSSENQNYEVTKINEVILNERVSFNIAELKNGGFIVLSNNKSIEPVIAYSFYSDFPESFDSTNAFIQLLIHDLDARYLQAKIFPENKWKRDVYLQSSSEFHQWPAPGSTVTGGWIETAWMQLGVPDAMCPLTKPDQKINRCVLGCTNLAWSQMLNYHQPVVRFELNDDDKYTTSALGIKIDEDSSLYDFPSFESINNHLKNIRRKYIANSLLNVEEIAALSFYVAIKNRTNFSGDISSASMIRYPELENSGFDSFEYYIVEGQSDWNDFYTTLKTNIMNGMPSIMELTWTSICNPRHVIICDGYNTNGFYHLNFGWGSDSPDEISMAWYNFITAFPKHYDIIISAIVNLTSQNIQPPPLTIDENKFEFGKVEAGNYSTPIDFRIRNNSNEKALIEPEVLDPAFEFSLDNISFSNSCEPIELDPGGFIQFFVRTHPAEPVNYEYTWIINVNTNKEYFLTVDLKTEGIKKEGTLVQAGQVFGKWVKAGSPYKIAGDVFIRHKDSLIIEPGVDIQFNGKYKLCIPSSSKLTAVGSKKDIIRFYAKDAITGWKGINFIDDPNVSSSVDDFSSPVENTLGFCEISHVKPNNYSVLSSVAAIYIDTKQKIDLTIHNSRICHNEAMSGSAIKLIDASRVRMSIINTLFENNYAYQGSIISLTGNEEYPVEFTNVTVSDNICNSGIIFMDNSSVVLNNSIIWQNRSLNNKIIVMGTENPDVTSNDTLVIKYCNIDTSGSCWIDNQNEGGVVFWNEGNISIDPAFDKSFPGEYILSNGSPCIDAGNPDTLFNDEENLSNPGFPLFPAQGDLRNDMGCYGGGAYLGKMLSNEFNVIAIGMEKSNSSDHDISIYPNPMHEKLYIDGLNEQNHKIYIYSTKGNMIKAINNTENGSIDFSKMESGLYILEIITDESKYFKRVIKL